MPLFPHHPARFVTASEAPLHLANIHTAYLTISCMPQSPICAIVKLYVILLDSGPTFFPVS